MNSMDISGTFVFDHNFEELKKYWNLIYETDNIGDDKTIRIVPQIKKDDNQFVFTANNKISSYNELENFIKNLDKQNGAGNVGYSISAAIFNYDPNNKDDKGNVVKPSTSTFDKIKKIVIDIDFHIQNSKDRFMLGYLDDTYIQFALITVFLHITEKLREYGFPIIRPAACGLTGSGLQIIFDLNRWLNKDEANTFFGYFKKVFKKEKIEVLIQDSLGSLSKIDAEIDPTFADIAHVQRALGTINQKYGILSKFLNTFDISTDIENNLENIRTNFIDFIENSNFPVTSSQKYKQYVNHIIERAKSLILNESFPNINVDKYLTIAKMEQYTSSKTLIKPSDLKNIETELLYKLKENNITIVSLLRDELTIDHESSRFIAIKCPFHEDSKYSFAIYVNDTIDILYDFHDGKSYTLITFWERFYGVNKTTAITQIAQKAGIKLGKSERKDFEELEIEEIIEHLLDKIDTEQYVYYRLANKNRVCIVRHKDSGEAFIFDGPKMLAHHVLENQLNINDVDKKFIFKFQEKFEERILMDAFEEFAPGENTVFSREFIKFVNLWVPSKNYKLAHEAAKELDLIDLEDSLDLIKEKCPWTFKYLLQITQKGNLLWFINWLANSAKFSVMSTVPIVFGNPGVGKNLFVNTIIEWYHNSEYTKVLNSDRVMSNFNSILESASFVVLDEGEISSSRDFDALKFLTGNDKIAIEKKGIDVQMKRRYFNIILFSNGQVPVRHSFQERRLNYFATEQTLLQSCAKWKVSIEELIENIKEELVNFWAILLNINIDKKWSISNEKDKLFVIQILKQHSFGELILKLLNNEWKDIALQLNENVQDPAMMKANLELLRQIQDQFEKESKISLTLINRYLNALNFRYKTSVQQFIKHNNLQDLGIEIIVEQDDVKIKINKRKLKNLGKIKNFLDLKEDSKLIKKEIQRLIKLEGEFEAEKEIENVEVKTEIENQEDRVKSIGFATPDMIGEPMNGMAPPPPPTVNLPL